MDRLNSDQENFIDEANHIFENKELSKDEYLDKSREEFDLVKEILSDYPKLLDDIKMVHCKSNLYRNKKLSL